MSENTNEIVLGAEITVKLHLEEICWESDLIDDDHFEELVRERIESGEITLDENTILLNVEKVLDKTI